MHFLDKGLDIKLHKGSLYNPDMNVKSESWVIMTPDRIKKEGCFLLGLALDEIEKEDHLLKRCGKCRCTTHTKGERGDPIRQRQCLYLNFSCFSIKCEFYLIKNSDM